jgi:hypothetical protein
VTSAAIFNLALLEQHSLFFNRDVFVWEDLDFNLRVTDKKLVLAKCYTHGLVKVNMPIGGCADYCRGGDPEERAGGMDDEPADGVEDEPATGVEDAPADSMEEEPAVVSPVEETIEPKPLCQLTVHEVSSSMLPLRTRLLRYAGHAVRACMRSPATPSSHPPFVVALQCPPRTRVQVNVLYKRLAEHLLEVKHGAASLKEHYTGNALDEERLRDHIGDWDLRFKHGLVMWSESKQRGTELRALLEHDRDGNSEESIKKIFEHFAVHFASHEHFRLHSWPLIHGYIYKILKHWATLSELPPKMLLPLARVADERLGVTVRESLAGSRFNPGDYTLKAVGGWPDASCLAYYAADAVITSQLSEAAGSADGMRIVAFTVVSPAVSITPAPGVADGQIELLVRHCARDSACCKIACFDRGRWRLEAHAWPPEGREHANADLGQSAGEVRIEIKSVGAHGDEPRSWVAVCESILKGAPAGKPPTYEQRPLMSIRVYAYLSPARHVTVVVGRDLFDPALDSKRDGLVRKERWVPLRIGDAWFQRLDTFCHNPTFGVELDFGGSEPTVTGRVWWDGASHTLAAASVDLPLPAKSAAQARPGLSLRGDGGHSGPFELDLVAALDSKRLELYKANPSALKLVVIVASCERHADAVKIAKCVPKAIILIGGGGDDDAELSKYTNVGVLVVMHPDEGDFCGKQAANRLASVVKKLKPQLVYLDGDLSGGRGKRMLAAKMDGLEAIVYWRTRRHAAAATKLRHSFFSRLFPAPSQDDGTIVAGQVKDLFDSAVRDLRRCWRIGENVLSELTIHPTIIQAAARIAGVPCVHLRGEPEPHVPVEDGSLHVEVTQVDDDDPAF